MRTIRTIAAVSICCLCMMAAGCGKNSHRDNFKAGQEALRTGSQQEAAEYFEKAVSGKPGNRYQRVDQQALRYLGIFQWEAGNYEEARDILEEALELNGEKDVQLDIYRYLGDCYEKLGEDKKAIEAFSRVLEKEEDVDIQYRRLYLQWKTGEKSEEEAVQDWQKAAEEDYGPAWYYLGLVHQQKEEYEQALKCYESCLSTMEQDDVAVYENMAQCWQQTGDLAEAVSALERGLGVADEEKKGELLWRQVAMMEELGRYAEAYQKAGDYLELFPDDEKMKKEQLFLQTRCD